MSAATRRSGAFVCTPVVLAIGCLGLAQLSHAQGTRTTLPEVRVTAPQDAPYKEDFLSSPKFTAPLVDTPKSITIIPEAVMQERGTASLLDVLRTTPGITLGSGEGGTPMGDRPFIRGYEASTDMMVDGVRDLGRFAHESFNIETIEIIKGPGGAYSGRGSTGGSINMVSKSPKATNRHTGSVGAGSDGYLRLTADSNWRLSDQVALRLNAMGHQGHVPGRDTNKAERYGFAPSVTFGMDSPTQATLSYYLLRADDQPDLGVPFDTGLPGASGKPVAVDRENFYGVHARDARRNDADVATVELKHRFGNGMRLRNVTRSTETVSQYVMTRPTIHAPTGLVARDVRTGNRQNKSLTNQTDLHGSFKLGSTENEYAIGLEFSRELMRSGAVPENAAFAVGRTNLLNPTPGDAYSGATLADFSSNFDTLLNKTNTRSVYGFNTMRFAPQWEANVGLRWDDYRVTDGTLSNSSQFLNYQAALVYKPAANGSIYVSYGTSSNPSGETTGQSGGADGAAGGGLGGGRDALDPERNRSFEIGTKWNVLDNKLALTAAVFRTEKVNQRAVDPVTGDIALVGDNRTNGFELGASGNISPAWTVFGGYTFLDPKVRNGGGDGSTNGKRLKFVAKQSFSIWSTYKVNPTWTVGGGANYMSQRWMNDANTLGVPAYWRFDAMVGYVVNQNLDLRLNVLNLSNRTIYEGSHVGLFANVGPGRSAMLTANLKF